MLHVIYIYCVLTVKETREKKVLLRERKYLYSIY